MVKGTRIIGILVFVAGIVMLITVFFMALGMLKESRVAAFADLAKELPREAFVLLARVLFVFALGFLASSVAARGIQMFEASELADAPSQATSSRETLPKPEGPPSTTPATPEA